MIDGYLLVAWGMRNPRHQQLIPVGAHWFGAVLKTCSHIERHWDSDDRQSASAAYPLPPPPLGMSSGPPARALTCSAYLATASGSHDAIGGSRLTTRKHIDALRHDSAQDHFTHVIEL